MIVCKACGHLTARISHSKFDYHGDQYNLIICAACDSLSYDPPPRPDFSSHTASYVTVRDYVEMNCAIDMLAAGVMGVLQELSPGKLLDIGCGFGFSTDVAKRLAGWDVLGVEPSTYGRLGAKALNVPMIHDFIGPNHPIAKQRFDVIFASEFIEHLDEPRSMMKFLRSLQSDGGLMIITTPDVAALDNVSYNQKLALLSPGSHTVLFSEKGLEKLLRDIGFKSVSIGRLGSSLYAKASFFPLVTKKVSGLLEGVRYIREVLKNPPPDRSLQSGLKYRLLRYLVDLGDLSAADEMGNIGVQHLDLVSPIETYEDFLSKYDANSALVFYYRGMLELNHRHRPRFAANLFWASYILCRTKLRLVPSLSVVEADQVGLALFHYGLASEYSGEKGDAKASYQQIMTDDFGQATETLRGRAAERLSAL